MKRKRQAEEGKSGRKASVGVIEKKDGQPQLSIYQFGQLGMQITVAQIGDMKRRKDSQITMAQNAEEFRTKRTIVLRIRIV